MKKRHLQRHLLCLTVLLVSTVLLSAIPAGAAPIASWTWDAFLDDGVRNVFTADTTAPGVTAAKFGSTATEGSSSLFFGGGLFAGPFPNGTASFPYIRFTTTETFSLDRIEAIVFHNDNTGISGGSLFDVLLSPEGTPEPPTGQSAGSGTGDCNALCTYTQIGQVIISNVAGGSDPIIDLGSTVIGPGTYNLAFAFHYPSTNSNINNTTQVFFDNVTLFATPIISCVGFEPPMDAGAVKVKKNKVLPLKAQLLDDGGIPITDFDIVFAPVLQIFFDSGTGPATDVTVDALSAGLGTGGNQFEFGVDKWQFNLKTKNYTAEGTYEISMVSGDSSEYIIDPICTAMFVIK